jgi:SAM-dependent methyltransferase
MNPDAADSVVGNERETAQLRAAWEEQAPAWAAWARRPGFDSYWRFHRDAFLGLLPPPRGLTVDVGCGEGRLARDLVERGHTVIALDASPTMVRLTKEASPTMDVRLADAARLPFPDSSVELVVAFMSFQDVDDMPGAVKEAARVLTEDGRLCIAIVHPINSAGGFSSTDADAPFVIDDYLASRSYVDVVDRDGMRVDFHSMHHPIDAYSRALEAGDLVIEAIREVTVDADSVSDRHDRAHWLRVPLFLHVRARPASGA